MGAYTNYVDRSDIRGFTEISKKNHNVSHTEKSLQKEIMKKLSIVTHFLCRHNIFHIECFCCVRYPQIIIIIY